MKKILLFVVLLTCIHVSAQITEVGDSKVSPDGKFIAFVCYMGMQQDIFLYSIQQDTLFQLTNSTNLNFDAQYKTSLNWLDDHQLLFLSKHDGMSQQYILDIYVRTIKSNGTSNSNEYLLEYSDVNNEVYYISSRKGLQPAVYRKKLDGSKEIKVSKGNMNCTSISVSPDGKYLTYKEMPLGKTVLVSLKDNKVVKSKLPTKNTFVLEWSPVSDEFIYKYSWFEGDIMKTSLGIYTIMTNTSETIEAGVDYVAGAIWSPSKDKYLYSLLNKSYLVDRKSGNKIEYDIIGRPRCWIDSERYVLFVSDEKAFILNLSDSSIKKIIN